MIIALGFICVSHVQKEVCTEVHWNFSYRSFLTKQNFFCELWDQVIKLGYADFKF